MLTRPHPLKRGDRVAVTAPASPVSNTVLTRAIQSIRFLGLNPVIMESCTQSRGYLAGPDAVRASDINRAFSDPSISGIFCLRGGYGTTRLLPLLDFSMIRENPKIFVGYSDITALHLAFNKLCGFVTFHGPMPGVGYDTLDAYSLESLKHNLFSDQPLGSFANPPREPLEVICPGKACGPLVGGNLSLLVGTLGSIYEADVRGKVLFLEEVGEQPYRLDRALTALSLAGKFRDCTGILLGTFAECEEHAGDTTGDCAGQAKKSLTLRDIFDEVVKPWGKPTLTNFRAGHVYPQSTVPLGTMVSLDTDPPHILFQS